MPIIDKINIANQKYASSLKKLQDFVNQENAGDPVFEKNAINMLLDMIEIKKEIDILEKVNQHQNASH